MKSSRFVCVMAAGLMTAVSAWAQWQTQKTLANNAYQGSIALDGSGNAIAIWYSQMASSRSDGSAASPRIIANRNTASNRSGWFRTTARRRRTRCS